jgi:hypothetical protein
MMDLKKEAQNKAWSDALQRDHDFALDRLNSITPWMQRLREPVYGHIFFE